MAGAILKYNSLIKLTGLKQMGTLDQTIKLNKFSGKVYLSTGVTFKNVKKSEILKDSSITSHAVYFSKLNNLFDELKRNLVESKWAKESDLNLTESIIDQITKFNQNNPKLVSINNRIKSTSDFNETMNYFNSNLNKFNQSEITILFRVMNIIDNRPSENELILNIEKQFYSLFQSASFDQQHSFNNKSTREEDKKDIKNNGSIDRASELNLQDFINFYHGFYKLRFKGNYSVDLMHFYSTATPHFCRLLNELFNNESIMKNDEMVKQILDGMRCFHHSMSLEVVDASLLATVQYCKSQKNIASIENLATNNQIISKPYNVITKLILKKIKEKVLLVNNKNYFEEWMFNYENFMKSYFSLVFEINMKDKQFEAIYKEMQLILKLFIDSDNFFDASNICVIFIYNSFNNVKFRNFHSSFKYFVRKDSFYYILKYS